MIAPWKVLGTLPPGSHVDWIASAAFSPDGSRVVLGSPGIVPRSYRVEDGRLDQVFERRPFASLQRTIFATDRAFAIAGAGRLYGWNLATGKIVLEQTIPDARAGYSLHAIDESGRSAVVVRQIQGTPFPMGAGELLLLDVESATILASLGETPLDAIPRVAFLDARSVAVFDMVGRVEIRDTAGALVRTLREAYALEVAATPEAAAGLDEWTMSIDAHGRHIIAFSSRRAECFDRESGTRLWSQAMAMASDGILSSDGSRLVVRRFGADFTAGQEVYDTATGTPAGVRVPAGLGRPVAWSADSTRVLALTNECDFQVWQLGARIPRRAPLTAENLHGRIRAVAVSPDDRFVLAGTDAGTLRVWDLATEPPRGRILASHGTGVDDAVFLPGGTRAITLSWDQLRVWRVPEWTLEREQNLQSTTAQKADVSRNGRWLFQLRDFAARLLDLIGGGAPRVIALQPIAALVAPDGIASNELASRAVVDDDGTRVLVLYNNHWAMFELSGGTLLGIVTLAEIGRPYATSAAFRPDGSVVVVTRNTGETFGWTPGSAPVRLAQLFAEAGASERILLEPENGRAALSGPPPPPEEPIDGHLRIDLREIATGRRIELFGEAEASLYAVTRGRELLAAGGADRRVYVWRIPAS